MKDTQSPKLLHLPKTTESWEGNFWHHNQRIGQGFKLGRKNLYKTAKTFTKVATVLFGETFG